MWVVSLASNAHVVALPRCTPLLLGDCTRQQGGCLVFVKYCHSAEQCRVLVGVRQRTGFIGQVVKVLSVHYDAVNRAAINVLCRAVKGVKRSLYILEVYEKFIC